MPKQLLVCNGDIWTLGSAGRMDALLIQNGRLLAVGPERSVRRLAAPGTRTLDLHGRTVVPGLVDAHTHLVHQGLLKSRVDLAGARSRTHALARVRAAVGRHGGRSPLLAERWDESAWPDPRWPTKDELDALTTRFPVVLRRVDGHVAVANTPAVRALKGRLHGVDPRTGHLVEEASLHLNRVWPAPAIQTRDAAAHGAAAALSHGITGATDFVTPAYAAAYRGLRRAGTLPLHVRAVPYASPTATSMPRAAAVKAFADGSLGAWTAALSEPYRDRPESKGKLEFTDAAMRRLVQRHAKAGIQPCIHAIGDAAIDQVLDAFARIDPRKRKSLRPRIEHAELVRPDQVERIRDLGVVLSMQPNFVGPWLRPGGLYEARLGRRARASNPFPALLKAGIPLAFGSDCMPLDPWFGLHCVVRSPIGAQRVPWEQALAAYTTGSAYAQHAEATMGVLDPGREATFVILDGKDVRRDPGSARVKATYVEGQRVR